MSQEWWHHWGCRCNPFQGPTPGYVATPPHDEAIARLSYAVEQGLRHADLQGEAGLGKSITLFQTLKRLRHPSRLILSTLAAGSISGLLAEIASGLRAMPQRDDWSRIRSALEMCRLQRKRVVLAIDSADDLEPDQRQLWTRLGHLDGLTLLTARRTDEEAGLVTDLAPGLDLTATLRPLSSAETASYLERKLALAGRETPVFSRPAIERLHAISMGRPAQINQLASMAMLAGQAERALGVDPALIRQFELDERVA